MLLFGHRFIPSESFYHITTIDAISKTPPSSKVFLEFSEDNLDIIQHLAKNSVEFVLSVENIRELIYASSLDASYILVQKEIAKSAQNIAESYLFDAKMDATKISDALLHRGVIIRNLASYGMNAIRITVGTARQNDIFFKNFSEVIA